VTNPILVWFGRFRSKRKRLVYAATARCVCGAGLAFDPCGESGKALGHWACSLVLLGAPAAEHCLSIPFTSQTIMPENAAGALGQTTRPIDT
jgi:hypothetical protein